MAPLVQSRAPLTTLDEAVSCARELAAELRASADSVDTGDTAAEHHYDRVRASGLLAILVPREFGGAGLTFGGFTRVLEELAIGDAATALGYTMHNVAIGSLADSGGAPLGERARDFRDRVFAAVVDRQRMFASATSEFGAGARLTRLSTSYRRTEEGYLLSGTKSFVSLAGLADHYVVAAVDSESVEESDPGTPQLEISHFVVSRTDPGVSFGGVWDGVALRGTETATMTLDDVLVSDARLFLGVEGMSLFKLIREPHWMAAGYLGAYLGIAESILRFAVEAVGTAPERRESAVVRAGIGRMATDLEAARALVYRAADLVDAARGSTEANTAVHAAKYAIGELAPRMALEAVRLCGSSSLQRSRPLERLLRESTFCSVMPAKPDDCLDFVGRAHLGFDVTRADETAW